MNRAHADALAAAQRRVDAEWAAGAEQRAARLDAIYKAARCASCGAPADPRESVDEGFCNSCGDRHGVS